MLDGLEIAERTHVVALGISTEGVKIPLGLWEGSIENATLVSMLLADLVDRGLDPEQAILFVIDGGRALRKAIKDVLGEHALVHRCHRHKERNVTDLLPERDRPGRFCYGGASVREPITSGPGCGLIGCRVVRRGWAWFGVRYVLCCVAAFLAALLVAPLASGSTVRGRILALARQEIGYREPGNYCTIFGPCEEWCSLFVTWAWRHAGVPVPSLAFTGYLYDWAKATTSIRGAKGVPEPGDAVLFGTGPSSVSTSLHVGVVEAAYPGYLVTIEGDSLHGVRRFVVPTRNPQSIGEPGSIYAYASPVSTTSGQATPAHTRALATAAALTLVGLRKAPRPSTRPPSLQRHRLLRTIAALRAFQHMPYRIGQAQINWTAADSRGLVEVTVASGMPVSYARSAWRQFLKGFNDSGHAYSVTFQAPPDAPVNSLAPSIVGVPQQGQVLTESQGVWSNNPTTYSYQWQDCDSSGNNCTPIAAATSQTYEPTSADVGHTIRVEETASNPGGSGQPATSDATAPIASSPSSPA